MAEESKTTPKVIQLSRREQFEVLASFEESTEPLTPDDQLEDITQEIFETLNCLTGC